MPTERMRERDRRAPGTVAWILVSVALLGSTLACARSDAPPSVSRLIQPWRGEVPAPTATPTPTATPHPLMTLFPSTVPAGETRATPTPDPIREAPNFRTSTETHIVRPGESLSAIAYRYGIGTQRLMSVNGLYNPNFIAVGQVLLIPPMEPHPPGPGEKLLPNSELVYGPSTVFFDTEGQVEAWGGALHDYREEVEGEELGGGEIVELVAQRYSVHPRLLLALLEYQGGWLTNSSGNLASTPYPLGYAEPNWAGLFGQLSWAADQLNAGFYLWRAGWNGPYTFLDGTVAAPAPGVNAGTVAVQHLFSRLLTYDRWTHVVGPGGFMNVYRALFGDPFKWAAEPLVPADIEQPTLQLPFERGAVWSFTSGPHGAWGEGSAWAAIDFAPPGFALGCVVSDAWVVASGTGAVVRSDLGLVVQDLDGDGYEQVGWALVYLHVESRERVSEGVVLQPGDRIGHPSCEGGVSTGTHLHMARKYNGVWLEADGQVPFTMDGWVTQGRDIPYDGYLTRDGVTLEACSCRSEINQIER